MIHYGVTENPLEITPQDLRQRLDQVRIVDVREPWDYQICCLAGAESIPMGEVPAALPQLDGDEKPLVVYCHHGVRSLRVANWLRQQGIDPAVPRYQ